MPSERYSLMLGGRVLEDAALVSSCGISAGTTLELSLPLRGGSTNGLSRDLLGPSEQRKQTHVSKFEQSEFFPPSVLCLSHSLNMSLWHTHTPTLSHGHAHPLSLTDTHTHTLSLDIAFGGKRVAVDGHAFLHQYMAS